METKIDTPPKKTKEEYRIEVGQRLWQFRKTLGKRQEDFAGYLNFGRSNLARMESGQVFPSLYTMMKLRYLLNLSPLWLMTGEGEMFWKKAAASAPINTTSQDILFMVKMMDEIPYFKHTMLMHYHETLLAMINTPILLEVTGYDVEDIKRRLLNTEI